jgi:hypothetical protein
LDRDNTRTERFPAANPEYFSRNSHQLHARIKRQIRFYSRVKRASLIAAGGATLINFNPAVIVLYGGPRYVKDGSATWLLSWLCSCLLSSPSLAGRGIKITAEH